MKDLVLRNSVVKDLIDSSIRNKELQKETMIKRIEKKITRDITNKLLDNIDKEIYNRLEQIGLNEYGNDIQIAIKDPAVKSLLNIRKAILTLSLN